MSYNDLKEWFMLILVFALCIFAEPTVDILLGQEVLKLARKNLKERRVMMGMTQEQLAKEVGVYKQQISDIERNHINCSLELALKISAVLEYNLDPTNEIQNCFRGVMSLGIDKCHEIAMQFNVPFDRKKLFVSE